VSNSHRQNQNRQQGEPRFAMSGRGAHTSATYAHYYSMMVFVSKIHKKGGKKLTTRGRHNDGRKRQMAMPITSNDAQSIFPV
jgi:hypothetical protein